MRKSAPVLTALLVLAVHAAAPAARQRSAQAARLDAQQPANAAGQNPGQAPSAGAGQDPAGQPAPQGAAQAPPDAQQPPRIRTGINYVRVDVIVTDKSGKPVLDLTPEDFSL